MKVFDRIPKLSVLLLLLVATIPVAAQSYNIKEFGAIADGRTDNTRAIQAAIDSCSFTGGTVVIPQGVFLSATLYLKSNVTLHLNNGATLLGHTDIQQYPYLDAGVPFYGDQWAKQALIFCKNAENVSIEGAGTIDGQGASFPVTTTKKPDRYKNRPYLLWFVASKNIIVKDVQLRNSAFWMQHYLGCEYLHINGIKVWNHSNKNNDMMDLDGCKYVTVSNVIGDSDDDGITVKSTSPIVSEHIAITNCVLSSHCNALKLGTESTGGFRNITITNCVIKPSRQTTTIYGKPAGNSGVSIELVDGGVMENISVSNLVIEGPQVPLFVRLGNRARKYTEHALAPGMGSMKNIRIAGITASGSDTTGCSFSGLANAPIENLLLQDIYIESTGGGKANTALAKVPEMETEYPEATMFGHLPAYGFYIRHAKGVSLSNIKLSYKKADARPGIAVVDTKGFSAAGLNIQSEEKAEKIVYEQVTFDTLIQSPNGKSRK